MDKYNFNWRVMISWSLPSFKRRPVHIAWIHAMCKFLRMLHLDFLTWGAEKKDEVMWNSQTIILRNLLIKNFGAGIYIENITRKATLFLGWPLPDSRNVISYRIPTTSNRIGFPFGQYDIENVGFIVWVPDTMIFDQDKMESLIDKYLMFGTNYKIQLYTL